MVNTLLAINVAHNDVFPVKSYVQVRPFKSCCAPAFPPKHTNVIFEDLVAPEITVENCRFNKNENQQQQI